MKTKKAINRGKRSKKLSEVKPVENIIKNLQSFAERRLVQKEVLPSNKQPDHAYGYFNPIRVKKNFMALFYGWGSTASRLESLRGGSLLFTTKFPEIPGTHFINLRRMKG